MIPFTIFQRLVLGNIAVLILVLVLGGVVSFNLERLQEINHEVLVKNQKSILVGNRIMDTFEQLVQFDEKYFVALDKDYFIRFQGHASNLKKDFSILAALMETKEQQALFNKTVRIFDQYLIWFDTNAPEKRSENTKFDHLSGERLPYIQAIAANINTISELSRAIITEKTTLSGKMVRRVFIGTIITTILTVLVGMAITIINTRAIKKSVNRLQKQTKEISRGRFEQILTVKGPKEIQDLARHFNIMCRRLEELDELKADFISHVSHELRTPITSIKEASAMLSKGFYADEPEKQQELLTLIREECQRLLKSVIRILDYSKMEARKMEYQIVQLNLPDIIRKSILKLAPLARKKKILLEFSPPRTDLPAVCADEDRLIEVLDNLVGNALKFTPSKGKIIISCRRAEEGNNLLVCVEDTGPGIKPEHLENIFYKFKQIDNNLNAKMGTGLGLSISKYIIKAHKGEIWAQNQKSRGAKILFTLPAAF